MGCLSDMKLNENDAIRMLFYRISTSGVSYGKSKVNLKFLNLSKTPICFT